MFRIATKNDKENLCELWQQGFNEGQKEASFVFESFADYKNIYIKEENNSPIAMLISVDVEMSGKKGAYFYGLTTLPQYQKNGVMSKLIDEVCDELKTLGYTFAVLIPQDKTLFDFYEKRGFKTQFYLRHFSHTVKSNVFVKADFDTVTAKSLRGLRRKFIKGQRVELNEKSE
ncbi:MAG: GNAT family N-acetyltransferase, partial [Oscillospiraceae bacterium]